MIPPKALTLRLRLVSRLRRPSSDGMSPWKVLFESWSFVRAVRLATQGGMEPVMPCDARSIATTRRALQVTPCHSQNSSVDALLLHEAKTVAGPESCDLKQRRACLSLSVSTSSQMADGRPRKKVKRQRKQTRLAGDKTLGEAAIAAASPLHKGV